MKGISNQTQDRLLENEKLKKELDQLKKTISLEELDKYLKCVDSSKCIICIDKNRDTIFNPCGHIVGCYDCVMKMGRNEPFSHQARCPICRKPIQTYIKMLFS